MKESGINYFVDKADVTDLLTVFYTFESGNSYIPSTPSGNPIYSGLVNNTGIFWSKPGSGLFSGSYITINQTGLGQDYFTNIFSFETASTGKQLLISTLGGGSGYEIGLNDAHKLYFRSKNNGVDSYATLGANLSSKNLVSIGYLTNYLELGYYNFNSQEFESESFSQEFGKLEATINSL